MDAAASSSLSFSLSLTDFLAFSLNVPSDLEPIIQEPDKPPVREKQAQERFAVPSGRDSRLLTGRHLDFHHTAVLQISLCLKAEAEETKSR